MNNLPLLIRTGFLQEVEVPYVSEADARKAVKDLIKTLSANTSRYKRISYVRRNLPQKYNQYCRQKNLVHLWAYLCG